MTPGFWDAILSGRRKGLFASFARAGLSLVEHPYRLAVRLRNDRFNANPARSRRVSKPVISVGNLTTGGTGKTPFVRWLCQYLIGQGRYPAIVSRGYGTRSGPNDEALELSAELPHVIHVQNPCRYDAAMAVIAAGNVDCIVLDDGFQHRQLARDLDIVLLDALNPFGYDHLLPRGFLREPVESIRRADVIALSRANQVSKGQRETICQKAMQLAPTATWIELEHALDRYVTPCGDSYPADYLNGKRTLAFCGIGNPAAFRETLRQAGCEVVELIEFPDHHQYTPADFQRIAAQASRHRSVDFLVCTRKDLVKIDNQGLVFRQPLVALAIEIQIRTNEQQLMQRVSSLLPGRIT